ncbi:phospholipid/cholesterol/gamma-HCH transport system substrate-binding protein [Flavobacterium fontis]|uniref:Phospholipid/cholesterol/gamma-HCH transport system substrate-binding protein n=1 Tax=Flavobacterium fontis TaxID=1124188 RepID=A0A1M4ZEV3_9FLAO|nr:MlaD family protein [Flavobacterium fontis]SHF16322.1 phospholipid/cholesterol/gamma-HCH transport system substrate-binding protein [Flavobacterium fontis]
MKLTRELKTAILVIASILLFIWGYSFLKGKDILSKQRVLYVVYDNVEGLEKSAPVTINGLTIGKVSAVTLDNETAKITVELQINTDFPIKEGSKAEIYAPSPIGGKQIAIIPATSGNLVPDGGQLVPATKLGLTEEIARQIEPLKVKVLKLLDNTNAMMENINQVMDASTKENLRQSLAHLDAMLIEFQKAGAQTNAMLAENQKNIKGTLTNADKASANFVKISEDLAKANWTETVAKLDETLKNVNLLLQQMEAGKGTMGKLMKDEQLYANFTKTSKELELLLQDLRLNPTRYVNVSLFGKKNKPYVAPVADTIKK